MLIVHLSEKVLNVVLDALVVHGSEDRLHRFRLREAVELVAPVHARELQNQREPDRGVSLDDILYVVRLTQCYH